MAQPQLSAAEIQARLGIKSNIFDKAAQQSSGVDKKIFEKFNGHEGDEYMLIFGASMERLTNTNQKLSGEHLQNMERQTAILSIAKALESMKDLNDMLKFLHEMSTTFKNNKSVSSWIKEQITNVKKGVFENAGKQFYYSLMNHWVTEQKAIRDINTTLWLMVRYKSQTEAIKYIKSYLAHHPSLSQKDKYILNNFKSIIRCFRWDTRSSWGFGHVYIFANTGAYKAKYEAAMKSRFGTDMSDTDLNQAFFDKHFTEEYFGWFKSHTYDKNIPGIEKDYQNNMNIGARQVANSSRSFASKANEELNNIMSALESITSADQQISTTVQNLVVNPKNMNH